MKRKRKAGIRQKAYKRRENTLRDKRVNVKLDNTYEFQ